MKAVRFDDEVSVPLPRVDPTAHVVTLAAASGPPAGAAVQLVRLPPAGRLGPRAGATRRMLAVVTGTAWAGTPDTAAGTGVATPGRPDPVDLGPGQGVVWEPGEVMDIGSPGGMSGLLVEGDFDVQATWVTQEIVVEDPDPRWAGWFADLRDRIAPVVAPRARRIDHVGSTSVPGLAAKPIIDMDVVVDSDDAVDETIARLEGIGYRWRGDLGVTGRQAFAPPGEPGLPRHHLYLVVDGTKPYEDHWLLRDLLRADPGARDRYAALKRRNAEAAGGDIDVYVAAKAALVAELLARARAERGMPPAEYWRPL